MCDKDMSSSREWKSEKTEDFTEMKKEKYGKLSSRKLYEKLAVEVGENVKFLLAE